MVEPDYDLLELENIVDSMIKVMREHDGAGLAAPQIGLNLKIFVWETGNGANAVVNPILTNLQGCQRGEEGCLSVPNKFWRVKRAYSCDLTGKNLKGEIVRAHGKGFLARVFQHELDHLSGKLILNRISRDQRDEFLRL